MKRASYRAGGVCSAFLETPMAKSETKIPDSMKQTVIAFAEQLGRIAGTVHAKAEGLIDRQALQDEIQSVRDKAASLLEQLAGKPEAAKGKKPVAKAESKSKGRSGGVVDAPGHKHRKPGPTLHGTINDSRIAKLKTTQEWTRRRSGPTRG
jgi:hypothetical protein